MTRQSDRPDMTCKGVRGAVCSAFEEPEGGQIPSGSSGLVADLGSQELDLYPANTTARGQDLMLGGDAEQEDALPRDPLVPRALLSDPKVGPEEFKLIVALLSYCRPESGEWTSWPSNARLAMDLGCTERSICRRIERLEVVGYVSKTSGGRDGRTVRLITLTIPCVPSWMSDRDEKATTDLSPRVDRPVAQGGRQRPSDVTDLSRDDDRPVHRRLSLEEHTEKTHPAAASPSAFPGGAKEAAPHQEAKRRKPAQASLLQEDPRAQDAGTDVWPWQWMRDRWNKMVEDLGEGAGPRKMTAWTDDRKKHARARIDDGDPREVWDEICEKVGKSPFLSRSCRTGNRQWQPDIDWLLKPGSWVKVVEGKYDHERGGDDDDDGSETSSYSSKESIRQTALLAEEGLKRWAAEAKAKEERLAKMVRPTRDALRRDN